MGDEIVLKNRGGSASAGNKDTWLVVGQLGLSDLALFGFVIVVVAESWSNR